MSKVNKFKEEEKWVNDYNNPLPKKPIVFKPYSMKSKHIKVSDAVRMLFCPIIK